MPGGQAACDCGGTGCGWPCRAPRRKRLLIAIYPRLVRLDEIDHFDRTLPVLCRTGVPSARRVQSRQNGIMKKIFVTGSAGFIGFHLCKLLLDEGFEVFCLDAMTDYYDVRIKVERHRMLTRSEEHKYELQSLMRISSAVFC